jgi:hypothetical protein
MRRAGYAGDERGRRDDGGAEDGEPGEVTHLAVPAFSVLVNGRGGAGSWQKGSIPTKRSGVPCRLAHATTDEDAARDSACVTGCVGPLEGPSPGLSPTGPVQGAVADPHPGRSSCWDGQTGAVQHCCRASRRSLSVVLQPTHAGSVVCGRDS